MLGGCGLNVPELQDFGARDSQIFMVQSIVHNINCELRDAFNYLYDKNPNGTFTDKWGIQVLLDLDITEQTSVAPAQPVSCFYFSWRRVGFLAGRKNR
jgi:hypothetical protein